MVTENILRIIPSGENPSRGQLWWRGRASPCALGKAGVLAATRKKEGDDASPAGVFPLTGLYYRADRLDLPETSLPALEITQEWGWCDDPACAAYNSAVQLPHQGSAETLWRDDHLYDLLVTFGHNQSPAIPPMGSAIFLHVARGDFLPTQGCVAVARNVLLEILAEVGTDTMIRIHLP